MIVFCFNVPFIHRNSMSTATLLKYKSLPFKGMHLHLLLIILIFLLHLPLKHFVFHQELIRQVFVIPFIWHVLDIFKWVIVVFLVFFIVFLFFFEYKVSFSLIIIIYSIDVFGIGILNTFIHI